MNIIENTRLEINSSKKFITKCWKLEWILNSPLSHQIQMQRKWFALRISQSEQQIFGSWIFQFTLKTDLLGKLEVYSDGKKNLYIAAASISKPDWAINCLMLRHAVHSVPVFRNFGMVFNHTPCACPLISVPIVRYVKSKRRVVHTMTLWFPDSKWMPVPCCLTDSTDFLLYNGVHCPCREHYTAFVQAPLHSVFCMLGLNIAGFLAARENSRVLCQPFHPLPRQAVWLNTFVQVEAKAAREERQAHRRAGKKQAQS